MLFKNIFSRKKSGSIAKDRLKILLVTDRVNCNPCTTEAIKREIIIVLSKYIDIDIDNCIFEIQQKSGPCLMASIPIKEVKV